jgi:hypothetical protein
MAKPSSRSEIVARIERIAALIPAARRLVGESRPLDLGILALAIADLRDAVRAAPAPDAAGLAPRIAALQADLDALESELVAARPADGPAVRRAAIRAYDGGRST